MRSPGVVVGGVPCGVPRSRPEPLTCDDRVPRCRQITDVSLRLLYLIVDRFLSWLILLGRATSSKDIELLVLRLWVPRTVARPRPGLRR